MRPDAVNMGTRLLQGVHRVLKPNGISITMWSDEELHWMAQEVRGYVEAVVNSRCYVPEKAKECMLNKLSSSFEDDNLLIGDEEEEKLEYETTSSFYAITTLLPKEYKVGGAVDWRLPTANHTGLYNTNIKPSGCGLLVIKDDNGREKTYNSQ
nr:hypothetical protein [Tanacetum cinerariifolium]